MDPIRVLVRRGSFVESEHVVHAVALRAGAIVEAAGDPRLACSLRSSAKPIQALALARAHPELPDAELAVACASHDAEPEQIETVRALLSRSGSSEDDLACGADARNGGSRILHNCSGKHAGFLAVCAARGWPKAGYERAEHPLQQLLLDLVCEAAELERGAIGTATDGCGVVCFSLPLDRAAHAFTRLPGLEGGDRVVAAMRARPDLVGGVQALDTRLMQALPGWIAKRGAEAAFCAASPDGVGVALKVADGSNRALGPALAAFLDRLGHDVADFGTTPIRNSRGEQVGTVEAV
jgi:L-asparaginase II